ncbi:CHC2-type zinc finger protein [Plasticicumulans lactativorans]|uniref:CHC2-type zinc finger protein n=1 Tax=Plasticicumulans lactativorans TaxID=1133106 RepID=A0A4R2LBU7_9GAMM|nr:CHC2 zinc finger domain-containing protein [Plasticicumulans lactativorans]TCO82994.1 CHC2-type zinc finger protein [Plasticicumulans lactativorans]
MRRANPTRGRYQPAFAFRRDRLPAPADYYRDQGLKLTGGGDWRSALCPFHGDTSPSLRVRIETGAFRCMACGAHGGDVLAFHMRRHELRFIEAAKALGAWEASR